MGTELLTKDYLTLLKEDIPNGRDDLINTSKTLEDVAQHCLESYNGSLEQTVNYTAQALGSVAYKINLMATNILEVLDQQNVKLNGLQTKVNHLDMQAKIHQEKSARLSIGKFTLPRDTGAMRTLNVGEPILEINDRYRRREIDFTLLDHIGHGIKEVQLGGGSTTVYSSISRQSSISGTGSDNFSPNLSHGQSSQGNSDYGSKYGKLQSSNRSAGVPMATATQNIFRTPVPSVPRNQTPMVSPSLAYSTSMTSQHAPTTQLPQIPVPNYGTGIQYRSTSKEQRRNSSASTGTSSITSAGQLKPLPTVCSPQNALAYGYSVHPMANIPPPPPPITPSQGDKSSRISIIPPPLEPPSMFSQSSMSGIPPPPIDVVQYNTNTNDNNDEDTKDTTEQNPYDSMINRSSNDPDWVPGQYLCKVKTLYEYQQNKEDELNFRENETIYVMKKNPDGWWEGVMESGMGLFPGNYVQVSD